MAYKKKTTDGIRGRPRKLDDKKIELALMLRDRGFNIAEIAAALGVTEQLLYLKGSEWEQLRIRLNAIKAKKEAEKVGKVSAALYDRAIGQTVTTKKEVIARDGSIVTLTEKKEIPGDVKAQEFYLINRDPQNWKAAPEETGDGNKGDGKIKIEIVEG